MCSHTENLIYVNILNCLYYQHLFSGQLQLQIQLDFDFFWLKNIVMEYT